MNSAIFFALCVAGTASLYQVFQRQSAGTNPYLVALVVSGSAILCGVSLIASGGKVTSSDLIQTKFTWFILFLIGLCAFGVDFLTSKAYSVGGDISIIGPVITSGIVVFSGILGVIFFKEPITFVKTLGLVLMVMGMVLTSWKK